MVSSSSRLSRVSASCLVATLGLATLMLIGNIDQSGAFDWSSSERIRGGRVLERPFDLLNKWVVIFRRRYIKSPAPAPGDNKELGFMSLGYGLYYRRDGWMMAPVASALTDAEYISNRLRYNVSGWFIHDKQHKHTRTDYGRNRTAIAPYRLILDHAITFPGPNLGVFRAFLDDYEGVLRTPPYGQPAWSIVYPLNDWLPEIAKETDQKLSCFVVIHEMFADDARTGPTGDQPFAWRFWPVKRKFACRGPICKFVPDPRRNDPYEELTYENQRTQAGQICDRDQDRGAPVFCHTDDIEVTNGNQPSLSDKKWKLAYTIIEPVIPKFTIGKSRECSRTFTAYDLSYSAGTLFDPALDNFVHNHYKPNVNPTEI